MAHDDFLITSWVSMLGISHILGDKFFVNSPIVATLLSHIGLSCCLDGATSSSEPSGTSGTIKGVILEIALEGDVRPALWTTVSATASAPTSFSKGLDIAFQLGRRRGRKGRIIASTTVLI